jgi:hypothetical protein
LTIHPIQNPYLEMTSEVLAGIVFALWVYCDYFKRIELRENSIKSGRNVISLSSISKCIKIRVYNNDMSSKTIQDELIDGLIEYVIYNKKGESVLSILEPYYFQDSINLAVLMEYLKFTNIPFEDDSELKHNLKVK